MEFQKITKTHKLRRDIRKMFPQVMKWLGDRRDNGDYHFFAAVDSHGNIAGAIAIDIGAMSFGPLKKDNIAYIEDIWTAEGKNNLIAPLLNYTIKFAKSMKCRHIRGQVHYKKRFILDAMQSQGFAIAPIDDLKGKEKTNQYLIIKPL